MGATFAGRFELIDQIGAGSAGTVWRGYDRGKRRYCAAKLVRQTDPADLVRVIREQGVRLDHPNVLSPYAWAAEDDTVLIATDLARGGSLVTLLRDYGALPARYVAEILAQLLRALTYVHAAGLVHRDVKPANVLLDATGFALPRARLSDFGIVHAQDAPRVTKTGFVVGTPAYLAPEALAGEWPRPTQDIYAAGVVAWQLLTGSEIPPKRVLPSMVAGMTGPVADLVARLLATQPHDRPAGPAAIELVDAIRASEPLVPPAHTADGEPIEVFDVLGPLPDGWRPPPEPPPSATDSHPTTWVRRPPR